MNKAAKNRPAPVSFQLPRYFCGSSPPVCALAWFSLISLLVFWSLTLLPFHGVSHPSFVVWAWGSGLASFVGGISSFCPLAGVSACLMTLSFVALLALGGGGAGC